MRRALRIPLEDKVMPKEQIIIHTSTEFKDALGRYAGEHGMTMTKVIREATAKHIGYDLGQEPARTRRPKYASEREAKEAQTERNNLMKWGLRTVSRLVGTEHAEIALVISKAVNAKDYDTLRVLKVAASQAGDVEVEEGSDDGTQDSE